ncbi:hypothetical protein F3Y22_tig00110943pilonHSYRG00039 [Hibiscus syriacus]|uniref:HMG box domain-containing protein n=1 Tax=Hibiscus syriacus TaxID=106335 RepID=A0A6A2ZBI1_HIBSY|nr:hypothetical protein F3Y22_tig00110943pilonHSYRG00039 [Hibiscus syriacus]
MKSMDLAIVVREDDIEMESESINKEVNRKQPLGGYMHFYMTKCQRMKEAGNHNIDLVKYEVLEKWKSMSDTEKEPDRPIQRELCRPLMEEFDVQNVELNMVIIHFLWGVPCVLAILGLEDKCNSVKEVIKTKNWKIIVMKYDLKPKVTYAGLEEEIKSEAYDGDNLKARVLLYLVGIFLCPMGDTSLSKDNMKLICDEGLKGELNWAEYVNIRLIELITSFHKGQIQIYLKGCITIEVVLFDFWSYCASVSAFQRTRVARIRAWGNEEVVRVMAKLMLERPSKQERVIGNEVEEEEEEEENEQ